MTAATVESGKAAMGGVKFAVYRALPMMKRHSSRNPSRGKSSKPVERNLPSQSGAVELCTAKVNAVVVPYCTPSTNIRTSSFASRVTATWYHVFIAQPGVNVPSTDTAGAALVPSSEAKKPMSPLCLDICQARSLPVLL